MNDAQNTSLSAEELWRQLEEVQAKMDEAIAERDAALARAEQAERELKVAVGIAAAAAELAPEELVRDMVERLGAVESLLAVTTGLESLRRELEARRDHCAALRSESEGT